MKKLELRQIVPYLAFKVKVITGDGPGTIIGFPDILISRDVIKVHFAANLSQKKYDIGYAKSDYNKRTNYGFYYLNMYSLPDEKYSLVFSEHKAILLLRPVSEIYLIPEIIDSFSEYALESFENAFFSIAGRSENCYDFVTYEQAELMFKYHIDLFGLIDEGLAVNINKL